MSVPRRGRPLGQPGQWVVPVLLGVLVVAVVVADLVDRAGLALAHRSTVGLPGNPFAFAVGLARGAVPWAAEATELLVASGVAVVVLGVLVAVWAFRRPRRRLPVDRAARHLGRGRDLEPLTVGRARATSRRLGGHFGGLPVGVAVSSGAQLVSGPEDVTVDVWGPRSGKTTTRVIPSGMAAPGWLVLTSNKRDAADALRDPRAGVGRVWVWDPQGLVGEPCGWFWNPLTYVTDENRAAMLARLWTSAARPVDARPDAYFDPAGTELLGHLLHAAALAGLPVTEVYRWLTRPTDRTAAGILAGAGHPLSAASVLEVVEAPDKQRAGVFGSAKQTVSFLTNSRAAAWVVGDGSRPAFDPAAFVRSTDSLFALSREGVGDTGPLTVALTVAVCEAAEELAKVSPGGRLATPGVVLLDEAANVVRWHTLPDLFSHYGSRGVLLSVFLQSWSQGVDVWGRSGMRKLWSAANVKVLGAGVSEVEFLSDVSQLIGSWRPVEVSRSSGRGGSGSSTSLGTERVLEVADLAELPPGRVVVLASGTRATLARTVPWWKTRHAAVIGASVTAHDPAAGQNRTVEVDVPAAGAAWS